MPAVVKGKKINGEWGGSVFLHFTERGEDFNWEKYPEVDMLIGIFPTKVRWNVNTV